MSKREQYRLGMSAYNAGRYEKAIELLTPLVTMNSSPQGLLSRFYLGQAHYHLGVRLFETQKYQDATNHFQNAAGVNSNGGGIARFLVNCYVADGRYDMAVRELESMLGQDPGNAGLRIRLALAQYKQGSPLAALSTIREGIARQPDHAELQYQLGIMLAGEDEFAEAERCFEMTIACEPTHAGAYERLAQICAVTGRSDRALEYLEQAHALDPWNARIAFQLSVLGQGEVIGGRRERIAWRLPTAPGAAEPGEIDRLSELLASEPDFVSAFLALPESEVDEEVFSTLAATLERALENHPEYADLHFHCGAVYRRLGRRVDAIEHTEQAVEINPGYVNALIQLAELYSQTDQWAMGIERLEQAIEKGADYPDVHCLIGRLYQTGGQTGRARLAFERALSLNQNYRTAKEALASLPA
ncbi:MAG TPA: tetratricopeptide repeat protein [Phycisphaerae bacterium]|nr:tetratricopeptide repeat protein [Phycisphaerae bacterium]HRY70571.1 tetratricopeptide repeat protein [Phycisphaerae bacterium]HSA28379.1 tetratricopeptide repeat protein [Phycisphaerae bacterium]